jgi:hypothetical protein
VTTFAAIVTSHANEPGLRNMLGQLRYQTRPPDETLVLFSGGPYDVIRLLKDFPDAGLGERPDRSDWGHEKRAEGLELASSEWVGFFNDDDSYDASYLEKLMRHANDAIDVVYCAWNGRTTNCRFALGQSTSGNYIVRTAVGREAGYTDRVYEADGTFIERVAKLARNIVYVPDVLYRHNEQ